MFTWYRQRLERQKKESYHRGYDWAAGKLLRGSTEDEIDCQVQLAKEVGSYTEFDSGAEDALLRYKGLT